MKRAARIVWNVVLLGFVSFWAWAIIPKVMIQFSAPAGVRALPAGVWSKGAGIGGVGFGGAGVSAFGFSGADISG